MASKFITFLSDFGYADNFVGTCHGVIKSIAPEVEIIDLCHGIRRHDIRTGALILANALPYMPGSVVLGVVDPGVGTGRRPLAIRTAQGRFLVGPDNGLLSLAAVALGGAEAAVELACSAYSLPQVCKTFEGRDLFSPVAAHLAQGVRLEQLGAPVPVDDLVRIELPPPVARDGEIAATVIYIDRFGNVQLNLSRDQLAAAPGSDLVVSHGEESWRVPFVSAFGDVDPEELLVMEDSYHNISFAVNRGDAARMFQIQVGDEIRFRASS